MCLAVPGKIEKIDGKTATVNFGGVKKQVGMDLLTKAKVGEYVIVHAGYAIQIIEEQDAKETLKLFAEIENATKNK